MHCVLRRDTWWALEGPPPTPTVRSSPLVDRAVNLLLSLLHVRLPGAWKTIQLATVTLWSTSCRWLILNAGQWLLKNSCLQQLWCFTLLGWAVAVQLCRSTGALELTVLERWCWDNTIPDFLTRCLQYGVKQASTGPFSLRYSLCRIASCSVYCCPYTCKDTNLIFQLPSMNKHTNVARRQNC